MSRRRARYRYRLDRSWATGTGTVAWVLLNPSTADATSDDPTIRRCRAFSIAHGFAAMRVVNLYAARATDPDELAGFVDPVGPANRAAVVAALADTDRAVFAWGSHLATSSSHRRPSRRPVDVEGIAAGSGITPLCLGVTASGEPRHPLYVGSNVRLRPFVRGAEPGPGVRPGPTPRAPAQP